MSNHNIYSMFPKEMLANPQFIESLRMQADAGNEQIRKLLEGIEEQKKQQTNPVVKSPVKTEEWLSRFITQDPVMLQLKEHVRKLARHSHPVLIVGETGTGKELLARALHGDRPGKFVDLNCAALHEHLIESELFGHVRGAFTGAVENHNGLFVEARDGTIFLDEIGELPPALQAKLLRTLQEKTVRKLGGKDNIPINCRVICATHHEISKSQTFRQDLYWRISSFELWTKPLRERREDIALIIKSLMPKEKEYPTRDWTGVELKGNVRELQKMVDRYVVLGEVVQHQPTQDQEHK